MTSSDELITEQGNVVTSDELADYQRWQAPHMVSVEDVKGKPNAFLTVEDIDALQKQAQKEGYSAGFKQGQAAGHKAGLQTGESDLTTQLNILHELLTTLNTPLDNLDAEMERDIVSLVTTVARQVIRREIKADPEHVIGAVRAALTVLPISDRKINIYLHPQVSELVKKGLSIDDNDASWRWHDDPTLSRGSCRLETANTSIDASVEARLDSVINKLLGGERTDDQSNGS
jgi:flagellar assembly protein FliH